ncbi:MAG: xanthine dehydrogenase, partial [Acidobacteria bacterium]
MSDAAGIGHSTRRLGGIERVTGAQKYAADLRLDNVLHVKLVTLPCARARVKAIDVSEATRVGGVRCVMTAADLPQPVPLFGPVYADRPVLAGAETKFFGEPVAAVAADNKDAAEDAASLIHVDSEQLPAVLTIDAALDPASPLVQDAALRKPGPLAATNTLEAWQFGWGNLRDAHAECVIEHDYVFPMVTHFAIEPHAFLAAPDEHGVTIWSPIQHPYVLQRVVA